MRITGIALLSLAGLVLWSGLANAEQRNRIIHFGDYDSFRVGPRQGWGACERACNGDPRCRAWTFIRSRRQCRLKYVAGDSVRNNCCVSGIKKQRGAGRGSKQRFCSDYATTAVKAFEKNLSERCGFRGQRWNNDYSPHYQYCLRVARDKANAETAMRRTMIEQCRSHAVNSTNRRCNHYARIAVEQATTNRKASCGYGGRRRWSLHLRDHVRRCRNNGWSVARDDTLVREQKLRNCLSIK